MPGRGGELLRVGLCSAALILVSGEALAMSVLRVASGAGQVGYSLEHAWRGDGRPTTTTTHVREWATLPLAGELLDRRVLNYRLSFSPRLSRWSDSESSTPIKSKEFDVAAGVRLMQNSKVSLLLDWDRTTGSTSGGLGTRSTVDNSSITTAVNFSNNLMPLRFSHSVREDDTMSRVGVNLVPFEQSFRATTLRLNGRNGKLSFDVTTFDLENRLSGPGYATSQLTIDHRLRWGRGSSLESSYARLEQKNEEDYLRNDWKERLTIQHGGSTTGNYSFERTWSSSERGKYDNTIYTARLDNRPRHWLSMGIGGATRDSRIQDATRTTYDVSTNSSLNVRLPGGVRFVGYGSVGYQWKNLQGADGFLFVTNEPERPDAGGSIVIVRAGIDPSSIVIRSADETVTFEDDLDYRVVVMDGVIEIRILPGGRIGAGETVLVSYRYVVQRETSEEAVTTRYSVALGSNGISVRHSESRRNADSGDRGIPAISSEMHETTTSIRVFRRIVAGEVRVDLSRRERLSAVLDHVTREANAQYSVSRTSGLQLTVSAGGRDSEQREEVITSWFAGPTVSWGFHRTARIRLGTRYQRWRQHEREQEATWTGEIDLDWRVASLETRTRIGYEHHDYAETVTAGRASIHVVRRF